MWEPRPREGKESGRGRSKLKGSHGVIKASGAGTETERRKEEQ